MQTQELHALLEQFIRDLLAKKALGDPDERKKAAVLAKELAAFRKASEKSNQEPSFFDVARMAKLLSWTRRVAKSKMV
jgi:heme oxygenase